MKHPCDRCHNRPATVHLTEIIDGEKIEKHLCEQCAANEGITVKANIPISQLLEDFILQSSDAECDDEAGDLVCDACGLSFNTFRKHGVLGCPNDYDAFSAALEPFLARAHEGATQHLGKVPSRAASTQKKQTAILRLRGELKDAVAREDYEAAAALRDRIKAMEKE
ncbi:MAG: UvrB/UvrC motif-containing protein [Phycisphaerae bacterium]|nr:UvrB/UvrC motif-containing protein [Phycisphaerae bacterium]